MNMIIERSILNQGDNNVFNRFRRKQTWSETFTSFLWKPSYQDATEGRLMPLKMRMHNHFETAIFPQRVFRFFKTCAVLTLP